MNKPEPEVGPRISREIRTITAMVRIYCRGLHQHKDGLCEECEGFLAYARARLRSCRYQENKSPCVDCPTHCYQPKRRAQVREIMRYAGPRMLWRHPMLALLHTFDSRRPAGGNPRKHG